MALRKIFILACILLTGLVLYLGYSIAQTWQTNQLSLSPSERDPLQKKKNMNQVRARQKKIEEFQTIIQKDIFGTKLNRKSTTKKKEKKIEVTALNLKLKGTAVGSDNQSYAIIVDGRTKKQDLYLLNEYVQGARVLKILPDRVILSVNGKEEALPISFESSPKKAPRRPASKRPTKRTRPIKRPRPPGPRPQR